MGWGRVRWSEVWVEQGVWEVRLTITIVPVVVVVPVVERREKYARRDGSAVIGG